jgi:hypothetical protein
MDRARKSIPRAELKRIIKRFLKDKDRGISIDLFADLCGLSTSIIKMVFIDETEPMTEYVQRRVSKGYTEYRDGEVAIMKNRDNTKFVQYRKEATPTMQRSTSLQMVNGQIKIKVGITNKYDYSVNSLDEQLERG